MWGVFMKRVRRQRRIVILVFFFFAVCVSLGVRLYRLQISYGEEYARASVIQRSLRYVYGTGRGQILDRHGNSLLDTRWEPVLVSFEPFHSEETKNVLAQNDWNKLNFVHVIRGLDSARVSQVLEKNLPGLIEAREENRYGDNSLASHVTGYVQRLEIPKTRPNYVELKFEAKSGLERAFNAELSASRPPTIAAMVDAHGRLIEGLGYRDWQEENPRRPYHLVTTIDSRIQATVERMGARMQQNGKPLIESGAVVILEPRTGDILAMTSFPEVRPGELFAGVNKERNQEINEDPFYPYMNKAIQKYAPGSVFKVILTAAAIENGLAGEEEPYYCNGTIDLGEVDNTPCFEGIAHGEVNMARALAVSCNGYFIRLGQKLGRKTVVETANRFKLGQITGIPLGLERAGNIPRVEDLSLLGEFANASIGQGVVETTPLQLARMMAIIANDGRDIYPRLLSEILDNQGNTVRRYPIKYGSQIISPSVARRLKPILLDVVETGTARGASSSIYTASGKSGTAQTGGSSSHSWFVGMVSAEGETYAVAVFLEHWKKGERTASTVFRQIMEEVFF